MFSNTPKVWGDVDWNSPPKLAQSAKVLPECVGKGYGKTISISPFSASGGLFSLIQSLFQLKSLPLIYFMVSYSSVQMGNTSQKAAGRESCLADGMARPSPHCHLIFSCPPPVALSKLVPDR